MSQQAEESCLLLIKTNQKNAGFLLGYIYKGSAYYPIHSSFFLGLFFDHENKDMFLRNVG
jgi:hypothetical protein